MNLKLKRITSLHNNKLQAGQDDKVITLENVESWTGKLRGYTEPASVSGELVSYKKGDVLFNKLRPYLAKVHLTSHDGLATGEMLVLRPDKAKLSPKYLFYRLISKEVISEVNNATYGVKMPRANWDIVGSLDMTNLPDTKTQDRLCNYLDAKTQILDKILTAKNHTHTHLSELRQAIITNAVLGTGGAAMNLQHTNIPWIGKIPAHWEVIKLKHILRAPVTDGPHETPIFYDTGVPFLSVDGIKDGELDLEDVRYVSEEDYLKFIQKAKPEKGDILLGKAASTGKIARVKTDTKFCIWSPLALLKIRHDIDSEFIEYVLKSDYVQHNVDLLSTFNTQKNISMRDIPNIAIALPPKKEREEIVVKIRDSLQKIDSAEKQLQKSISQLEEYRSSLISNVVGGKVEV